MSTPSDPRPIASRARIGPPCAPRDSTRVAGGLVIATPARFALVALVIACFAMTPSSADERYGVSVSRPYEDVVHDIKFAITGENFRITGGNVIGQAINKRHALNLPRSEIIHFCNLEHAREFLRIDPSFIRHMPCKIIVREDGDHVWVETQLLPPASGKLGELTNRLNGLLKSIVDEVAE